MRETGITLPERITRRLTPRQARAVRGWWRTLDRRTRRELCARWDERGERLEPGDAPAGRGAPWRDLPLRLRLRFVSPQDAVENEMWTDQLREYVTALDVPFFLEERTFHICRAHPLAAAVVTSGIVPAGFRCPLARKACPLAAAARSRPGAAALLTPYVVGQRPIFGAAALSSTSARK